MTRLLSALFAWCLLTVWFVPWLILCAWRMR